MTNSLPVALVRFPLWLCGWVLILMSCQVFSRVPAETETPEAAAAPADPTVTPTPSPRPLTATPSPPPERVEPDCVLVDDGVRLTEAGYEAYPDVILAFLNAGGTPAQLDAALYSDGVAGLPVTVRSGDMTGDGKAEVVVSIFDPGSENVVPPGTLLIYHCLEGAFGLAVEDRSAEGSGPPHLWYLDDLDADGADELVVSRPICGAHTCFEDVRVLAWDGAEFANVLEGSTTGFANPDVRITDEDGDGAYDVELAGGSASSVGAGPPREGLQIWRRNQAGIWSFEEAVFAAPVYRFHALQDAEAAARAGDLETALVLYSQVVEDDTLLDWLDPEVERANLSAYGGYKMVVLYVLAEQPRFAELGLASLQESFPPSTAQSSYVDLAELFLEGYRAGGVAEGCAAAIAFAAANPEAVLAPLGEEVFGYGNPGVEAFDMCP